MQLRTKVILFLSALIISLAVLVVFYLEYSVRASFKKQVVINVQMIAKKNEALYQTFVEGLKMRTVSWSSDKYIKELSEKIVNPSLNKRERMLAAEQYGAYVRDNKIQYDPFVAAVDLIDQNGIVVASSNKKRIGKNALEEEELLSAHYFSQTIHAGFGETFSRSIVFHNGDPMFHVTTRLFSTRLDADGKFVPLPAVLLIHFVELQQLSDFMSQAEKFVLGVIGESDTEDAHILETYIVTREGQIVSSTNVVKENQNIEGSSTPSPLIAKCFSDGEDGTAEYINRHGVPVVGALACLFEEGVAIVTEEESVVAYAIYDDLIQKTIIVGGMVLIVVILLVFWVIRHMMRRFNAIVAVSEKVSSGDFKVRVMSVSNDEIGRLATTFNTMLSTIEISHKKLSGQTLILENELKVREGLGKFLEDSKRATLNLLEDAWAIKEKLEVETNRLNAILTSMGDGLILIDGQYNITLMNPKAEEIFMISSKDLLTKDLRTVMKLWQKKTTELMPPEWPIEEMFLTQALVVTDMEDDLSITTDERKTELPIALSVAPLGGGLPGAVIVFRDVTDDRELDEAKSGFISVASHQLRTPLTTIRWYSEMLLSGDAGDLTEDQRDFLQEIHGGAERLYQTIDLLLGISRVESGKQKLEKLPINLTSFTEEIVKELRPQIDMKKIIFTIAPPDGDGVIVMLDPLTFRQVILNLLSNSIRYTNDEGTIEARWSLNENKSEVTYLVRDNGIGIPLSQQGRIFSKFFRAENALKKAPDGTGLGLALVKDLAESWGGKVWFETAEGQGTTFYFTVPLVEVVA